MAGGSRTGARARLVAELAAGVTVHAAAAKAGVGERTAYRWLADGTFKAEVAAARAEMVTRALGRLSESATAAADALRKLLDDPTTPATVRLGTARAILELGARLRESTELEERLSALEAGAGIATR